MNVMVGTVRRRNIVVVKRLIEAQVWTSGARAVLGQTESVLPIKWSSVPGQKELRTSHTAFKPPGLATLLGASYGLLRQASQSDRDSVSFSRNAPSEEVA